MNRPALVGLGVICWTIAALDVLIHLAWGDLLVPIVLVVVFLVWSGVRRWSWPALSRREAEATTEVG